MMSQFSIGHKRQLTVTKSTQYHTSYAQESKIDKNSDRDSPFLQKDDQWTSEKANKQKEGQLVIINESILEDLDLQEESSVDDVPVVMDIPNELEIPSQIQY